MCLHRFGASKQKKVPMPPTKTNKDQKAITTEDFVINLRNSQKMQGALSILTYGVLHFFFFLKTITKTITKSLYFKILNIK